MLAKYFSSLDPADRGCRIHNIVDPENGVSLMRNLAPEAE